LLLVHFPFSPLSLSPYIYIYLIAILNYNSTKAVKKDIRPIFTKNIRVLDTSKHESLISELATERQKRILAEEEKARFQLLYHGAKTDVEIKAKELLKLKGLLEK